MATATYLDVDDAIRTGVSLPLVLVLLASARIGHPSPWADIAPGTSYVTDAAHTALPRLDATPYPAWVESVVHDAASAMGQALVSLASIGGAV